MTCPFVIMNNKICLKAYRLSESNFLSVLKVANIRCFILIKCSEQKSRFKKSVIMVYSVKRIQMLVESSLTRPNYKSAAFPKFAEQRVITAINNLGWIMR